MPYRIVKQDDKFCVAKADTGEILDGACHDTREDAANQITAIEINEARDNKSIYFGSTVKSLGGNRIGGYLVEFTDENNKDLDGEYFTKDTDFLEDEFPVVGMKVLFNHGMDKTLWVKSIGEFVSVKKDAVGIWAEAILDEHGEYNEYVQRLKDFVAKGIMSWSSGAFPQSVVVEPSGWIKSWGKWEGSLTHTPSNPTGTKIQSLKSIASLIDPKEAETPIEDSNATLADLPGEVKRIPDHIQDLSDRVTHIEESIMNTKMSDEQVRVMRERLTEVMDMLMDDDKTAYDGMEDEIIEEVTEKMAMEDDDDKMSEKAFAKMLDLALEPVLREKLSKIQAEESQRQESSKAMVARLREEKQRAAKGFSQVGPQGGDKAPRYEMNNMRYAHLSPSDLALGVQVLGANAKRSGYPARLENLVSEEYIKHMAHSMEDYADSRPYKNPDARKTFADNLAIKSALPFKANELDASNIAGQGQEWVAEWWSTDVWRRARFERAYDQLVSKGMMVQEIPNGHETAHFPTEGSDPVVYTAPQANSVDATGRPEVTAKITPIGTGEVTLTPKELKLATSYTRILDEDAIVNYVQQLNYQVQEKMLETRDQVIINGDTETAANTNINLIDGTPATGLETPYYINSNGFRKLPLVTNVAGSQDAAGANSIDVYRTTLGLLDGELRQYKDRMLYLIDPSTENASLGIPAIATDDVRRSFATITSGVLTNIYGIDVATNGFVPLANTAGKVSATPANNTTGTICLVYAPYWGVGYRRQITVDTAFDVLSGSFIVVTSMRMGIIARGNNASVLSYNVGVS